MGIADGMSRRGNTSDFYITPPGCVQALLDRLLINKSKKVLDPCCGTGVIGKVLRENKFLNITEYDINEKDSKRNKDFYNELDYFDVIIANPPYSHKNEFITKALNVATDVYMLLPVNVISYNDFHRRFLKNCHYIERLLMTPKFFMTNKETNNPRRGGTAAYAWFHWSNQHYLSVIKYSLEHYVDLENYFN